MKTRASHPRSIEALEQRTLLAVDFTIASITDTQYAVESLPGNFIAQTQWIAAHAGDPAYKIAFVSHQGDMLRRGYSNYQAGNADAALDLLDGVVPYTVGMGNHDFDNSFDDLDHHISSASFTSWFGDSRYQGISANGMGGSSLDQGNRFQIFTGAGRKYLALNIEWEATDSSIAWAQGVINSHRELPTILITHEYLNGSGRTTSPLDPAGNSGESIFLKLVKLNPQIFLVLSGHTGALYHQASTNTSTNVDYQRVLETVGDFEGRPNFGDGYLQLFQFDSAANTINVASYSATLNQSDTSAATQYSMSLDFSKRFGFASGVVANDDTFDTLPGQTLNASAMVNDYKSNAAATLTASLLSGVASGALTFRTDGTFTYVPVAGYRGTVSFTYRASDGTNTSNTATVFLRVNTAPAGAADWAMVPESKSITINVVSNDTDADGDALKPILTTLPAHGAVFADATGTLTYTPDPRYVGPDSFTYKASDGKVVSAPVTVSVSVQSAAPIYSYPIGESTVTGTATGSRANLQATDGILETIAENASRVLDQRWQFNVTGGTEVTVCMNAWRASGADEYALKYSADNGATWNDMNQIVPASSRAVTRNAIPIPGGAGAEPAEPYQMWLLPAATSGTIWIKATQSTKTYTVPSALAVDELFIRSGVPTGFQFTGTTAAPVLEVSAGMVTLADDLGSVKPNCTARVLGGTLTATTAQHWASAELSGGGKLNIAGNSALFSSALSIASGSVLDLAGGTMVLSYAASSPADTVRQYIQAGKLLATGAGNTTLAQVDNSTIHQTSWDGVPLGNGTNFKQVLVRRVPIGDTNLDGQVTQADYVNLIANMGRTGAQWLSGDLDHDGIVTTNDLAAVSANLGAGSFAAGPALNEMSATAPAVAATVKETAPGHGAHATRGPARKPARSSRFSVFGRLHRKTR